MTVASLRSFSKGDIRAAGGKGANLGELVRAGLPVPDGFVVTTDDYRVVAAGVADWPEDGEDRRAVIERAEVPAGLRSAILEAYRALGGGPVAVRSSATAEDLPGAAFAGQQDTYLNVIGEEALIDAVRRCWGSLWSDRAIAYRDRRSIDEAEVAIAVVVQRMVDAEMAGVLFTANPVSGARDQIIVNASSGLGEAVVAGLVTPDSYTLDEDGAVLASTAGTREVVIRGSAAGGVMQERGDVPVERLADSTLGELARLGRLIADHFGAPQDIEWALAAGKVWILQARPMTALPPPPVALNRLQRTIGAVLYEYLPYRPYPIDMTTWVPYGPAGLMARMIEAYGLHHVFDAMLVEEDGIVTRFVPPVPRPTPSVLLTPFRIAWKASRFDPARWTNDPRFVAYRRQVAALSDQDVSALPWPRLLTHLREALESVAPIAGLRIDYLPGTGVALLRLLVLLTLVGRRSRFGDLIQSAHTRTVDANRALVAIADLVRGDPDLLAAVIAGELDRACQVPAFRAAWDAFLAEYGHRETSSPLFATAPTWSEATDTVLGLVAVLASKPGSSPTKAGALCDVLRTPLVRLLGLRGTLRRAVAAARAGIAFREDSHFYFTLPLPVVRRALFEIGRRLAEAAVIDDAEAVYHLRLAEIQAIDDPGGLSETARARLRRIVQDRADRRAALESVPLIDSSLIFPKRDLGDSLVIGTSASGGQATGPVRIIRDPSAFGTLQAGDILVCPYTNPSWTPLFQRAAAVVVDSGGIGSHAAIVAREYGIPAIMATGFGTSTLVDGQQVTVDGNAGRVYAA